MSDDDRTDDGLRHESEVRLDRARLHGGRVHDVVVEDFAADDVLVDRTTVREALIRDTRLLGVDLQRVEITGELEDVTVNGVDIGPLVQAELDRRHPDLPLMRPTDADGFRRGFALIQARWADTVERARRLPRERLHESVDGEWSFTETLRHLAFATESWVGRLLLGDPSPWHPLSLPWDGMPDTPGVPRDRDVRPDLDTVLALREGRATMVRQVLDGLTDDDLDRRVVAPDGVGWPPAGQEFPLREPLLVVLNEEFWHRQYAERDLAVLESRDGEPGQQPQPNGSGPRVTR